MTVPVLVPQSGTAAALLRSGDAELLALLQLWVTHREPPVPLIDWFMDRDLLTQAAAVRWVYQQPLSFVFPRCFHTYSTKDVERGVMSKPFPVLMDSLRIQHNNLWSWIALHNKPDDKYDYADRVVWLKPTDGKKMQANLPTLNDALIYLIDGYPKEML